MENASGYHRWAYERWKERHQSAGAGVARVELDDGRVIMLLNTIRGKIGDAAWAEIRGEMETLIELLYR
jgi:hypothetical protein